MTDRISPDELERLLAAKTVRLLDVRRPADRDAAGGGIPGAEWRSPEEAEAWAHELAPDKPVVIYCVRGGSVSAAVYATLTAKGCDVRILDGGLAAWEAHRGKG
ncbi:rhodanese-like domain-containing protein [Nitratidesulfovibrio vulgaris]|uniref:rhodanese-like domain-containing protein n=1 Tax=Nitratidesulfovibrio vulgaris TaxID=881 RepID=UPI0013E0742A|nr:rhodanese-like domain-containing protein [Nitratidesulfovibrio vulgaris]